MYQLKIESTFSAAHAVRFSNGCAEPLHGHNWRLTVCVAKETLNECAMVVDFEELPPVLDIRTAEEAFFDYHFGHGDVDAAFAEAHHVSRIAFEMHPGFCVYNPETMLRLRNAVGPVMGANFDPSHLFWQGIDPVAAIRELAGAIGHFHAKDTRIEPYNTAKNGVLDTKHYGDELNRSWIFRSVGYGHDHQVWCDMMSQLVLSGYEGAICIEHEDSLMSSEEGLEKAVDFLKDVIIKSKKPGGLFWA